MLRTVLLLFLSLTTWVQAEEMRLRFQPRWAGAPLAGSSAWRRAATGQEFRITRLAALWSGFQLLRTDGSLVKLDHQFGLTDLSTGRLEIVLQGVPPGEYAGLQATIGLPNEINHADPARWPARHPLHPQVNALHWSWQGGYVFLALEGFWRNPGGEPSGFSYHLAREPQQMRVRFLSHFRVQGTTRVDFAWEIDPLFRHRRLALDDGSDTTHSAAGDPLAPSLARLVERSLFWLEAKTEDTRRTSRLADTIRSDNGTARAFVVPAGFPQPTLPADNPLTEEGIALGRKLFFDRRLSGNSQQSCASCHDPGVAFSDRVAVSRGAEGRDGERNSMPLFNLAWHPAYAWDGTKPSIREQALAAMANPVEMNAHPEFVAARLALDARLAAGFRAAFGSPAVTPERIGLALEQFLLTLVSAGSRFDAALAGRIKLTTEEERGFELFRTEYDPARGLRGADCFHCHGGALFSDFVARSNGLDQRSRDAGAQLATGRPEDHGRFKTPSLRNIALTAPYMHDGRFTTLEAVVAHYDHGVQRTDNLDPNLAKHPRTGLALSPEDQRAIVAFLRTLTDLNFTASPELAQR